MLNKLCGSISLLRISSPSTSICSKRFLPAYAPKPVNKPRYLWDERDLVKKTGGKYTHEPLRINRLGGRDPETGLYLFMYGIVYFITVDIQMVLQVWWS